MKNRFLSLILILFTLLAACSKKEGPSSEKKAIPVSVITIEPKDIPVSFDFIAQTQSSRAVQIQARVSGFLERRVYTEGEFVKEGQILFLMDKKPFVAQLNAAKAALDKQKAAMETALLNLNRTKPLAKQNALSQKDLDNAVGTFQTSAAGVEQAKAQLEIAELNLSYCTITSPLDGITSAAVQQDGSYLNVANSQLTTVSALNPIWVNFSVSENQMQLFKDQISKGHLEFPENDEFLVKVVQIDGSVFPHTGRITFREPYYNPQTGTFLIRASVENPEGGLVPNQYVHAILVGAVRPKAIAIPQRAVLQSAKGNYVWVINNEDKAEFRPITVGEWDGDNWFITDGLQAGERVVVNGTLSLSQDQAVTITSEEKG